jgi:putative acetyltransferase
MAVRPALQRRGIGSALVREGLARCRAAGHRIAVVLGHPEYYPRFGFSPGAPRGIRSTWEVPDDVFMVLELVPGALDGVAGIVHYRPEFAELA